MPTGVDMLNVNQVQLSGKITKFFPIRHYDNNRCKLLVEIMTDEDGERYTHRVTLNDQDALKFVNEIMVGDHISFDAKLCPRPMSATDPSKGIYFEIKIVRYFVVSRISESNKPSPVKQFLKKFKVNTGKKTDAPIPPFPNQPPPLPKNHP